MRSRRYGVREHHDYILQGTVFNQQVVNDRESIIHRERTAIRKNRPSEGERIIDNAAAKTLGLDVVCNCVYYRNKTALLLVHYEGQLTRLIEHDLGGAATNLYQSNGFASRGIKYADRTIIKSRRCTGVGDPKLFSIWTNGQT